MRLTLPTRSVPAFTVLALGAATVLGPGALAQNQTVFPSDHANYEGEYSQTAYPFSGGVRRQQAVLDRWDVKVPHGRSITKVGVRPDGTSSSPAFKVQMEILMGHSTLEIAQVKATFAQNYDGNPVTVFTKKIFDLPALTAPMSPPSKTPVLVPLDTPFQYDSAKNLVIDWKLFGNSNGNNPWSYWMDQGNFFSATSRYGTACNTSANKTPEASAYPAELGGYAGFSLKDMIANTPMSLIINLQAQVPPLPLDFLGATGCSLHVDPTNAIVLNVRSTSSGSHSLQFVLPAWRQFYGQSLNGQYVALDAFANNAGIVTTNAAAATLGIKAQVCYVAATGDAEATTGGLQRNAGYVHVLEHN